MSELLSVADGRKPCMLLLTLMVRVRVCVCVCDGIVLNWWGSFSLALTLKCYGLLSLGGIRLVLTDSLI